jgi:hypothetical protein
VRYSYFSPVYRKTAGNSLALPGNFAAYSIKLGRVSIKLCPQPRESIKLLGSLFVKLIPTLAIPPLAHSLNVFVIRIGHQQPFA